MAAYLVCVTVSGGVPLCTRRYGDIKTIPFAVLASLNGVAMFGQSNDVTLISTSTDDCRVIWRDYHNSVRLILAVPNDCLSELHVHRLMDQIFQSLVLIVGLDELISQSNIDRMKRDLRASFNMIDSLLATVNPSETCDRFGDLVGASDCVAFPEANQIQNILENFADSVDSTYGCVLLHGKISNATKNWWALHPDEINILSTYITTDNWATIKDTPIFLPVKSPTVPFRLITCELIENVTLCVLCGPTPTLIEVEQQIQKHFKTSFNLFCSLLSLYPRNFPNINLDPSILGFMLINLEKRRVLSSGLSSGPVSGQQTPLDQRSSLNMGRKFDILRTFYRNTVGPIFLDSFIPSPHAIDQNGEFLSSHAPHNTPLHHANETYLTSEYHKCMAIQHQQYQFFALFVSAVPNHAMRNIGHRTLQSILRDKQFYVLK